MYSVHWSTLAELTFADEVDFILKKWNQKEVDNFVFLVEDYLKHLSSNPFIGINFSNPTIYYFVISKQTTLYYKISEDELKIDLILFWNNKKNPKLLDKYFNQ